jgi:molybdopterin-dependent oxidoreductase alpha subunit
MRFSEQLILLSLNDDNGEFYPIPNHVFDLSLAAAIVFELSYSNIISDDSKEIKLINLHKHEDFLIDQSLNILAFMKDKLTLKNALASLSIKGKEFKWYIVSDLLKRKVLKSPNKAIFSNLENCRIFKTDLKYTVNLKQNIRNNILNESVPDPEILVIISILKSCRLTETVFNAEELEKKKEYISFLSNLEPLSKAMLSIVSEFSEEDWLENYKSNMLSKNNDRKDFAGGIDSIISSAGFVFDSVPFYKAGKLLRRINQHNGFVCTGCAWPDPEHKRAMYELCESGAKNISSDSTNKVISSDFFDLWEISDMEMLTDYWLENRGRIVQPMFLKENSSKYEPISYEEAFTIIAEELNRLDSPDEAAFYTSGRTSNEAAFMLQLFARVFGTNNLPGSANLCHEPSGKALSSVLGFSKGSVSLDDLEKADSIFIFGHNPGSNHPRMLKYLEKAALKGCKIVAVNPIVEPSLVGFSNPHEVKSLFGKFSKLSTLYVQPIINGDNAFIKGMIKYIFEINKERKVIDKSFIKKYTRGFKRLQEHIGRVSWDSIIKNSGVQKDVIEQAAEIYCSSNASIVSWCLGITQHKNALNTIYELVNLLLLRGNIGKPGAGIFPVRGHSNVQGNRTVGIGENMSNVFLNNLSDVFGIEVPKKTGLDAIKTLKAMHENNVKVFVSLGGNLLSAAPDHEYAKEAFKNCNLTVMISTKLNRNHIITGKNALILPCLVRSEIDKQNGKEQFVTIESAIGDVSLSKGVSNPINKSILSETSIIARMAKATVGDRSKINWMEFSYDYSKIRELFPKIIPDYKDFTEKGLVKKSLKLPNPLKNRIFNTESNLAIFSVTEINNYIPKNDEFLLMSIRSHDQFNTAIFGLNDRYRGIRMERKVLFMNENDMIKHGISDQQKVEIISEYQGKERKTNGYYAIPYKIKEKCVAAYFPEINNVFPIDNISENCTTPAYKSLIVKVIPIG